MCEGRAEREIWKMLNPKKGVEEEVRRLVEVRREQREEEKRRVWSLLSEGSEGLGEGSKENDGMEKGKVCVRSEVECGKKRKVGYREEWVRLRMEVELDELVRRRGVRRVLVEEENPWRTARARWVMLTDGGLGGDDELAYVSEGVEK